MSVRTVVDTDVVARGLLSPVGPARELIDAWLVGRFTQVTSVCLADELRHILNYAPLSHRLRLSRGEIDRILGALLAESEVVPGHVRLNALARFPQQDRLLSCAVEGKVDYLVTSNIDLLGLGEYGGFTILTPESMLTVLPQPD